VVAVLTALAFVGVGAMALVHAQGSGGALFGRAYLSKKVIKNGAPHTLVEGTKIRVKFEHRDNYDNVGWHSGCNYYGAHVDVRPKRLKLGGIGSTAIGCSKPLLRQDEWVGRFFGSDPRWVRHGRRLRLRAGDDVIKLRRPA
jgi:heat shock protein HslJ